MDAPQGVRFACGAVNGCLKQRQWDGWIAGHVVRTRRRRRRGASFLELVDLAVAGLTGCTDLHKTFARRSCFRAGRLASRRTAVHPGGLQSVANLLRWPCRKGVWHKSCRGKREPRQAIRSSPLVGEGPEASAKAHRGCLLQECSCRSARSLPHGCLARVETEKNGRRKKQTFSDFGKESIPRWLPS